ncbi:MAG: protein translocase subunit SecDF, partial [Pseudomonadota bacterium]
MLQIDPWKRIAIWMVVAAGLLFSMPNGFYSTVERSNDAEALIAAGETNDAALADADAWPSYLPSNLVNLGLDLRGGAQLLVEVQVEQVYQTRMEALWPEVRDALVSQRDAIGFVTNESDTDGELRVRISQPGGMDQALALVRALAQQSFTATGTTVTDIQVE